MQTSFYILHGQDDFSVHQSLEKIKQDLGNPEMLAVNTTVLDGQHLRFNQLEETCSTVPFLSPFRLIIVNGLLKRFESKSRTERRGRSRRTSNSDLEEWQALLAYSSEMPSTTVLALVDGKIDSRNPLLKSFSPAAKVMAFPWLYGKSLGNWIQKTVAEGSSTISPEAVGLLTKLIGGDLWTMSCEIDKLLVYSSGRLITESDVKQLTSYARETNIFALVDAVIEGQLKVAQQLLYHLLQEGMTPSHILVMITRQLRLIVRAKELSHGSSQAEVQDKLGTSSSYVLDKALKQTRMYTPERIKIAYNKLLEADIAIKTGKYNDELALDILVIELCQG